LRGRENVEVLRTDIRGKAHHFVCDAQRRGVERRTAERLASSQLNEIDERLREPQLIRPERIAREAYLCFEEWVSHEACPQEIRARDSELRECCLQARIVHHRDGDSLVGRKLALQQLADAWIVGVRRC